MIMYVLGIDTSCDETSASVIKGSTILSNVMPSQIEFHSRYGGVVPSLAKLAHQQRIDGVVDLAIRRSGIGKKDIDLIAVTVGPGLAIALEVGIKKAKELSKELKKPVIGVNHMEGHLFSGFLEPKTSFQTNFDFKFPSLGVLCSGGHSEFVSVSGVGEYKKIGETLDDACGECFDKCARIIGLGYPGGKVLSKFADINRINVEIKFLNKNNSKYVLLKNRLGREYLLPIPMATSGDFNLSFSGLKTAFASLVQSLGVLTREDIYDLCVVFETSAIQQIIFKLDLILQKYSFKEMWLGGGVFANNYLNSEVRKIAKKYSMAIKKPYKKSLTGDNAAMIAFAGLVNHSILQKTHNLDQIDRIPSLEIDEFL